jgi:hypothetical protein
MHPITALAAPIVLLCVAQGAGATGKTPFQLRCEREMTPTILVEARDYGYRIDNTVSSKVLHNRAMHSYSGDLMLGLTALESRVEVTIDGPALQDRGSDAECIAPRLTVALHYLPMNVYIAREFSPASCSYREILAHEMRHVRLYREHLPKVQALVRTALAQRFPGTPLYAGSGQGLAALERQVDTWLRPLIRAELAKVEIEQKAIDTDEESFRLSGACHGELAQNLGRRY